MKTKILAFAILLCCALGTLAQTLPDAPTPKTVQVQRQTVLKIPVSAQPKFWDGANVTLFLIAVGAKGYESAYVCKEYRANPGYHQDFLPFAHGCESTILFNAGEVGAGTLLSFIFHRTHHHALERLPNLVVAGSSAGSLIYTIHEH